MCAQRLLYNFKAWKWRNNFYNSIVDVVCSHFTFPTFADESRQQTRKWEKDDWICKVYMTHNSLQSENINLTFMISNNHSCLLAVNNKLCRRWCMRVVELFTHWMRGSYWLNQNLYLTLFSRAMIAWNLIEFTQKCCTTTLLRQKRRTQDMQELCDFSFSFFIILLTLLCYWDKKFHCLSLESMAVIKNIC